MKKPLLAIRTKNIFKQAKTEGIFDIQLKNISINGVKQGCSGFILNTFTGKIAYINTEYLLSDYDSRILVRSAKDFKDYTGGQNRFCSEADLVSLVYEVTGECYTR